MSLNKVTLLLIVLLVLLASYAYIILAFKAYAQIKSIEVYEAKLGPIHHKLPSGKVVTVYATILYPNILFYTGRGPYLYPSLKVNVTCNWTSWGATVVVGVLDINYTIDPSTLKPAEWGSKWASGGCIMGPGAAIYSEKPVKNMKGSAGCSVNLTITSRLLKEHFSKPLKYFFKISISLYDPETGSVVPGGYVYMYTRSQDAPAVSIEQLPATIVIESSNNSIIVEQGQENNSISSIILVLLSIAVAAGVVVFLVQQLGKRYRRTI